MFASPFGEKFHLRTHLKFDECCSRLNERLPSSLIDPGFSNEPVGLCKRGRIYVWYQHEQQGAQLHARLIPRDGGTEIVGASGGNGILFSIFVATAILLLIAFALDADVRDDWWYKSPLAFAFLWLIYRSKRNYPFGGTLIDFVQQLLEAENLLERKGDPIART